MKIGVSGIILEFLCLNYNCFDDKVECICLDKRLEIKIFKGFVVIDFQKRVVWGREERKEKER